MKRRDFLRATATVPLMGTADILRAKTQVWAPTTPEELYTAANALFTPIGKSSKAYEVIAGKQWYHATYAVGYYDASAVNKAVKCLWNTMLTEYNAGAREILWRVVPTTYVAPDAQGKMHYVLRARYSLDDPRIEGRYKKREGEPVAILGEGE